MSPVVGVPKREPCQKCGMPVFLAERLSIGRALYHRTCLRCARCNSQLTLGSFYETETDGEFCCETCPDEETKSKRNQQSSIASSSSGQDTVDDFLQMDPTRKSFSEKLAMFQTNDKALLQKSLSDEEKSKSLQRLSELYARNVSTNVNDVSTTRSDAVPEMPTNFETDDVNDIDNDSDSSSDTESEIVEPSSILDEDEAIETSQAPPIPTKPPPPSKANVLNLIYGNAAQQSPIKSTQRTVSIYENGTQKLHNPTTELPTAYRGDEPAASQTYPSIASRTNLVDSNCKFSPSDSIATDTHAIDDDTMPSNHHHHHQQETIPNVTKDETVNWNESTEIGQVIDADAPIVEIVPIDSISTEMVNDSISGASDESQLKTNVRDDLEVEAPSENQASDQIELVASTRTGSEQITIGTEDAIATTPSKPVPVKRASVLVESNDSEIQPPTPMRRRNISNAIAGGDSSINADIERNPNETIRPSTTSSENIPSIISTTKSRQYPVQLNPFGDTDEEEEVEVRGAAAKYALRTVKKSSKLDNSNPFDSSDDEIELLKDAPQKATERKLSAVR